MTTIQDQARAALHSRVEDIATTPAFGFTDLQLAEVDIFKSGGRLDSRIGLYRDAFAAVVQDLRVHRDLALVAELEAALFY